MLASHRREEVAALRSTLVQRARHLARIAPAAASPPAPTRILAAAAVAVAGSLAAAAALVRGGTALFPSTRGYAHFRPVDYAGLTVVGVLTACVAWPVVARLTPSPRWLFLRLAVVVTALLWLPDLWLIARGQPLRAVGVLMAMHLAIALVTYQALVRVAPAAPPGAARAGDASPRAAQHVGQAPRRPVPALGRAAWAAMLVGVCTELVVGMAALVFVPIGRRTEWLPSRGQAVYLLHGVLGAALAIAALAGVVASLRATRIVQLGALLGAVGVGLGAVGGVLDVYHSLRIVGMGLMLAGTGLAFLGYLIPVAEPSEPAPPAPGAPRGAAAGGRRPGASAE